MYVVKSLTLRRRNSFAPRLVDIGPLEGEMELQSDKNKLEIKLTAEQTQRIVAVVAEALVDTAKEAASIMTAQVLSQVDGVQLLGGE